MSQTTFTYSAYLYLRIVAAEQPRETIRVKYLGEDSKAKKIICESEQFNGPAYDLFAVHAELASISGFRRNGKLYEYLSSTGKISAELSETRQTLTLNLDIGHAEDCPSPETCSKPHHFGTVTAGVVLERKGFVWKPKSLHPKFALHHMDLMALLAKIAYMPNEAGTKAVYCLGGTDLQQSRETKALHLYLGASCEKLLAYEQAERLVVPAGKEKNKRFSKRKAKNEDGNEHEQIVVAGIAQSGRVEVTLINEVDLATVTPAEPADTEIKSLANLATTDEVPYNQPPDDELPS